MTSGQSRVLVLMLLALGIEALFSKQFTTALSQARHGSLSDAYGSLHTGGMYAALAAYLLALLAILALADPAPTVATWIALLILVYALLSHGAAIVPFINNVRFSVAQLSGRGMESGAGNGEPSKPPAPPAH